MNEYQKALDGIIECYEELESRVGNDPNKVRDFPSIKALQELIDRNAKLEKTIKLLTTKINLHIRKEEGELKNWWTGETLDENYRDYHVWANRCGVRISKEEYELLEEVTKDDKCKN